jgi:hypothetical protein
MGSSKKFSPGLPVTMILPISAPALFGMTGMLPWTAIGWDGITANCLHRLAWNCDPPDLSIPK